MQVAHKIELKPNNKQTTYFRKACGTSRFAYNWALSEWEKQHRINRDLPKEERTKISGYSLKKKFNSLKKEFFPWAKEVSKYAAQQPFLDLQKAYNRFFNKQGSYPQKKKKGKCRDSFYLGGNVVKLKDKKIFVSNLGWVRLKEYPRFEGKINSATFSRTADRWFVSIQFEVPDLEYNIPEKAVGLDIGIKSMVVTSDGESFSAPKPLKKYLRKLKRYQKKLSKKTKGSKGHYKQRMKVARIYAKIANIRKDSLHKVTSQITNNYNQIAIEDLHVKGMLKNHKLARALSDVGFGEFRRQITYKALQRKSNLVVIDRFYPSSKTCPCCGNIKQDLELSDRVYECEVCNHIMDRDLNASINILNEGIGRVTPELTPVEIMALYKLKYPVYATSIIESGNEHQRVVKVE